MAVLQSVLILAAIQAANPWQPLGNSATGGGISSTATDSGRSSLAVNASGQVFVMWQTLTEGSTFGDIQVGTWTGAAWEGLGPSMLPGGLTNSGVAGWGSIVTDASGNPLVAYYDKHTGNFEIYIKRWDGATWVGIGTSAADGGITNDAGTNSQPVIVLDSTGKPVVTWRTSEAATGGYRINLKRWDGANWVGVGASETPAGISGVTPQYHANPTVTLDASDRPIVAWYESYNTTDCLMLRRWDGSQWSDLGGSATGYGLGRVMITTRISMVVDPAGAIWIAWADPRGSVGYSTIYAKKWADNAWTEVGGSATGMGISQNTTTSLPADPQVILDAAGKPVIAWASNETGNYEIYLRRWTGSAWVGISGSESGGGISATPGDSTLASMARDAFGNPMVAWQETVNKTQIYLRGLPPPPMPPSAPTAIVQLRKDGVAALANGATTREMAFTAKAKVLDLNGDRVRIEVEARAVGTTFLGQATDVGDYVASGSVAKLTIASLAENIGIHWQIRASQEGGDASAWVPYGGNPETEADFNTATNHAPIASSIEQISIWDRGVVSTLKIRALLTDADADDTVRFEVEIRPVTEAFTGIATSQSAMVAPGATVEIPVLLGDGIYRWRHQTVDALGKTSGWKSYGNNPEWAADFSFPPFGSTGPDKPCSNSATASPWILSALLLVAATFRRNR